MEEEIEKLEIISTTEIPEELNEEGMEGVVEDE